MAVRTGWGKPPMARKWHYFGSDGRALCRKYAWLGHGYELDDTYDSSPENCVACKRKRAAIRDEPES